MLRVIGIFVTIILLEVPEARSYESSMSDEYIENWDFEENIRRNNSNCTNDLCVSDEEYIDLVAAQIIPDLCDLLLIAMHSIVFAIGLIGNSLVCIAVYRNHSMRTVTNYFIVNLAVADLLVILFCLPSTVLWDVTETWFLGLRLCKAIPYLQVVALGTFTYIPSLLVSNATRVYVLVATVSVSVSVMTLTFISIDRWYAICFPLRFKSTTSRAKKAIFLIWLVAFVFDIPDLVVLRVIAGAHLRVETIYYKQCAPSWGPSSETTFTFLKLMFLYFGPLSFMTVAYYQIVRVLWKSDIPGHNLSMRVCQVNEIPSTGLGNPEGQLRSRRKAAKMLVAVVIMFAICYLPVHLLSILRITVGMDSNQLTTSFSLIAHWLCYANSAVNPLIYNFMSGKFRKEFKQTFCCSGNGANNHRGAYKFAVVSTTGRRSQMHTRSIHTTTNNNVQQSVEFIPLSAISSVQNIEKRD